VCVNLSMSAANCGSCGHACGTDQFCSNGMCQTPAATCQDGIQNEGETDVDCGGTNCPPCVVGKHCQAMTDCAQPAAGGCTQVTCTMGVCTSAPLSADTMCSANGGHLCESSGNCVGCVTHADCQNEGDGACVAGVCQPASCSDGFQNGNETDVDCGGGTCPGCADGKKCKQNTDCASSACDFVTGLCVSSTCSDQRQDGAETGIDCGGGTCPACANGKKCVLDRDCISDACDSNSSTCVSNQCADGTRTGTRRTSTVAAARVPRARTARCACRTATAPALAPVVVVVARPRRRARRRALACPTTAAICIRTTTRATSTVAGSSAPRAPSARCATPASIASRATSVIRATSANEV
jgi:hypothetical protein